MRSWATGGGYKADDRNAEHVRLYLGNQYTWFSST